MVGGRAMTISNIQYSDDSMSRVLACTCKLQSDVFLVRHSLSFVTLDSGGDRDTSSATTVIGSTSISVTVRAATATTYRCRFCSKLCGLGPADTHRVELAGRQPPVDRSLCHHNYRTRIPQPADASLVVWDTTAVVAARTLFHSSDGPHVGLGCILKLPTVLGRRAVSLQK